MIYQQSNLGIGATVESVTHVMLHCQEFYWFAAILPKKAIYFGQKTLQAFVVKMQNYALLNADYSNMFVSLDFSWNTIIKKYQIEAMNTTTRTKNERL